MAMENKRTLKGRSLLRLSDLTDEELEYLLDLSDWLKTRKRERIHSNLLYRKNIALIFEKPSTRTRSAFTVAAMDEGANVEYFDSHDLHLGKKESIKDTARVFGRMYDGIQFRGFKQSTIETLAQFAGVPVWNGLTDEEHPTQAIADLMTIREYFRTLKNINVVYIGDGRNNVCLSLMMGCAKVGANFINCTPKELMPDIAYVEKAKVVANRHKSKIIIYHDPYEAVKGANVIYTDVWVSMGEENRFKERYSLLKDYQVTMELIKATGNLEKESVIFLHCLPAFHNNETDFTKEIGALEVTDEVFEAPFSKVFDLAENRLHTIKAIMVATLSEEKIEL